MMKSLQLHIVITPYQKIRLLFKQPNQMQQNTPTKPSVLHQPQSVPNNPFLGKPTFNDIISGMTKKFEQTMIQMCQQFNHSMQGAMTAQMEVLRDTSEKIVGEVGGQMREIVEVVRGLGQGRVAVAKQDQQNTLLQQKHQKQQTQKQKQQQPTYLQQLNTKIQDIRKQLSKVNTLLTSNQPQPRSKPYHPQLQLQLEPIPPHPQPHRLHQIKCTVSRTIAQIFSTGFNLFHKQRLDFDKVKIYCCENFLHFLCQLITTHQLDPSEIEVIDRHLKDSVIPYLKLNYPYSEEQEGSRQLLERIVEYDRFNQNQFDIVYRSGVAISHDTDDIDKEVMRILNYVIELPDRPIDQGQGQRKEGKKGLTYYEAFQRDFNDLFRKVEIRDWTNIFYGITQYSQYDTLTLDGIHELEQNMEIKIKQEDEAVEAQKYRENVRSYTHYKIGRKLSPNVEKFSEKEIQEGFLHIKDFALARVLTKWIESLQDYFKNAQKTTYERQQPFRLFDGQQVYQFPSKKLTSQMLTKRFKQINTQLATLTQNLYQSLKKLAKDTKSPHFQKLRQICSDLDASIGHLSTVIVQCGENYVCNYLKFILGKVKELEEQFYDINLYRLYNHRDFLPRLVNFKLGDLMRCLITSKEREIVALYQYLKLQCHLQPSVYEMVRVKNRFNGPNKDVLINIFYRKSIMIEIQLAIKSQSSFLACSDKFNHFIYELGRVPFGPISQLCNVWTKYSPKSKFLNKQLKKLNTSRYGKIAIEPCLQNKPHIYSSSQRNKLKMPYWCSLCDIFRSSGPKNQICQTCNKIKRCFACKKIQQEEVLIKERFDYYEKFQGNQFPQHGTIFIGVDLNANKIQEQAMIIIDINEIYYLLALRLRAISKTTVENMDFYDIQPVEMRVIEKVSKLKKKQQINAEFKKYLKDYLLLKSKIKIPPKLVLSKIIDNFWLKQKMKNIYKDSKKSFNVQFKSQTLQKWHIKYSLNRSFQQNVKYLQKVQKIILHKNLIPQFPTLGPLKSLKILFVGQNNLISLDLRNLINLVQLTVSNNFLTSFTSIKGLQNLVKLQGLLMQSTRITNCNTLPILNSLKSLHIQDNQMKQIGPDFNFENYPNLQSINLKGNMLQDFDQLQGMSKLIGLRSVNLRKNQFRELGKIPEMAQLETLDLSRLRVNDFPTVGKFKNLRVLNLEMSRYQELRGISQVKNLTSLNLNYCIHFSDLKDLGQLKQLKKLCLFQNAIFKVDPLQNLTNLQYLSLGCNHITDLSSLKSLHKLKYLDANGNKIPNCKNIPLLDSLEDLLIAQNPVQSFEGLPEYKKLKKLVCSNCSLSSFKDMPKLKLLQFLRISNNKIANFQYMPALYNLEILQLSGTLIQNFQGMPPLVNLYELKAQACPLKNLKGINKLKQLQTLRLQQSQTLQQIYDLLKSPILHTLTLKILPQQKTASIFEPLLNYPKLKHLQILEMSEKKLNKYQGMNKLVGKLRENGVEVGLKQDEWERRREEAEEKEKEKEEEQKEEQEQEQEQEHEEQHDSHQNMEEASEGNDEQIYQEGLNQKDNKDK